MVKEYFGKSTVVMVVVMIFFSFGLVSTSGETTETSEVGDFPYPGDPWAWEMIGTQYAHQMDEYGDDVLIAVLDTGIDYNHPDLEDKMWEDIGYDFVNDDDDPMDEDGHGTHVAGIVSSVAPEVELMALKVIEDRGGDWIDLAKAIQYAHDNGADIITMSLGAQRSRLGRLIELRIDAAYEDGILLTAAAGNNDDDDEFYPAAYESVMGVSAVNSTKQKAYYSNYGDWIEIAAPGGGTEKQVYSTLPDESYGYKIGTSMACPFVTGAAALRMSAKPEENNVEVREVLQDTAIDLGDEYYYGHGLVNAYKAAGGEVPTLVQNLTTSIEDFGIDLNWEKPWDEGTSSVEGYRIYRGEDVYDMEMKAELDSGVLNYEDNEVEDSVTYYYSVTAFNSEGESFQSEIVSETTYEEPYFEVEIYNYNDEAYEGDKITVEYEVENLGRKEGTQDIIFSLDSEEKERYEGLILGPGETHQDKFIWHTEKNDTGEYEIKIESEDTSDSAMITIHSIPEDESYFVVTIDGPEDGTEFVVGETITVEYGVNNSGGVSDTQDIIFTVNDDEKDSTEITLDAGEVYNSEFIWEAEYEGEYYLEISSDNTSESVTVNVKEDKDEERIEEENGEVDIPGWTFILFSSGVFIATYFYYVKKK